MLEDEATAETVASVIGTFPADWSAETRSLVEEALAQDADAAQLIAAAEHDPWGSGRGRLVERLVARCRGSRSVRDRFEALAASVRLLAESLELAQDAERALRVPSAAVQGVVVPVLEDLVDGFPRVVQVRELYEANSDVALVRGQWERALAAVLSVDPGGRESLVGALGEAAARTVVHRWRGGAGPEWLPVSVRFELRNHSVAIEAFEALLDAPSDAAAERFVEVLAPLAASDPLLRRGLLAPEVGGMGDGPSVDLEILGSDGTCAPPEDPSDGEGAAPPSYAPPSVAAEPEAPPSSPPGAQQGSEPPGPVQPPETTGEIPPYKAHPVLRPEGLPPGESPTVHAGQTFALEVGIGAAPDRGLVAPRRGIGDVAPGMLLTIQLVFDPASFRVDAPRQIQLRTSEDERFPTTSVLVEVLPLDDPAIENRRIAAHFYVDDELRAVVFRTFREAGSGVSVDPPTPAMIDLAPLLDAEPPEVVLAIYAADSSAPGKHMIAAFPRSPDIPPPEVMRVDLDPTADTVMTAIYQLASSDEGKTPKGRADLIGKAVTIGDALPDALLATLRAVAAAHTGPSAPRMLLLTEEPRLPWELAALRPDRAISSSSGGSSPFLGAHFAIGRWPLSAARREQPMPAREPVRVRTAALVSAEYNGVGGWDPLAGAIAEIKALEESYGPAVVWPPLLDDVLERLADDVDVVHFALHGQFDASDAEQGLVLLQQGPETLTPTYLGADTIRSRLLRSPTPFPTKPFVFLNACQVGQHRRVLGDYAGVAVELLRAGARGVVACVWNVDDGVAGSISRDFYRRADAGESPAEILRAVRARWDPSGDVETSAPTLLAYQFFGHPSLRVQRTAAPDGD